MIMKQRVFLAFKSTAPTNPTIFQELAVKAVKSRLVSKYSHGGVVVGDNLLHVTTHDGLHMVKSGDWNPDNWTLFEVDADADQVLALFEQYKGYDYDWFSLLAFTGLKASDSKKLYCYEWIYLALTGINPNFRVTPEILMILAHRINTKQVTS